MINQIQRRIDTIDEEELGIVPLQMPTTKDCVKQGEDKLEVYPNPSAFNPKECKECSFMSICGSIYNAFKQIKKARNELNDIKDIQASPKETD